MFKVSNVEYRHYKLDVRIVPHAIHGGLPTRFAECAFIRRALRSCRV